MRPAQHHPALPWKQAPAFMADAATRAGRAWPLIRFAVLTAARSGDVRFARSTSTNASGPFRTGR